MRADTPTLREQLLTCLQTSAAPLTTAAVTVTAPPVVMTRPGCSPTWHTGRWPGTWLTDDCHGDHHVTTRLRYDHEVYAQLRALERAGLVKRIKPAGGRCVYWCAARPARPVDDLEDLWSLPARKPHPTQPNPTRR